MYSQMTSLDATQTTACWLPPPCRDNNSQYDFVRTIIWFIEAGGLRQGDTLVLDNARIHFAAESSEMVAQLLDAAGVRMVFLPAYSPELNPCELVFGHVKQAMSFGRAPGEMWAEALGHFARVTFAEMDRWYKHCIITPLGY
jgi:hypothetical protein